MMASELDGQISESLKRLQGMQETLTPQHQRGTVPFPVRGIVPPRYGQKEEG